MAIPWGRLDAVQFVKGFITRALDPCFIARQLADCAGIFGIMFESDTEGQGFLLKKMGCLLHLCRSPAMLLLVRDVYF